MARCGKRGLQITGGNRGADQFSLEGKQHAWVTQSFAAGLFVCGDVNGGVGRTGIAAGHPGVVDDDLPAGALDDRAIVHGPGHSHRDFGGKARGKSQKPVSHGIHSGRGQQAGTFDNGRVVKGLTNCGTGDQPGERYRITADIQNAASAECRVIQP